MLSLYSVVAHEAGCQSRGLAAVAPSVCDSDYGVHYAGEGDDSGRARLLQTYGGELRQGKDVAISPLLQDRYHAGSSTGDPIIFGLQIRTSRSGACGCFAADFCGRAFSGICPGGMGF